MNYNGVSYSIPAFGDVGYAQGPGNLSSYLIALAGGPQATGGLFSLTAPLNFGPNFGLIAVNYTTTTANPATAGQIRLAKTDTIDWRNNANSANLALGINVSDQLTFNGVVLSTPATGGTVNTGVAGNLTLYPTAGNTVDDVYTQNAFGINILIAAQAARSIALQYTIPNPGNAVAAATFALLELAQTFTAAQTFAQTVTISATTNQIILGTTNRITLTSPAPAASLTYTIPDVLAAASFLMTEGNQSINGTKTFLGTGSVVFSGGTTFNNNVSLGANNLTNVGTIGFSNTAVGGIIGTTTNNNAASGNVGERISSAVTGVSAADSVWTDITSISLTAGDWDVYGILSVVAPVGGLTSVNIGISTTAGNSATGLTQGDTRLTFTALNNTATSTWALALPCVRMSLAGTTTIYLKFLPQDTVSGNSTVAGRITARRVR